MLRKKYSNNLFTAASKEIPDGLFASDKKYAVFNCIRSLRDKMATLDKLKQCVLQNGEEALECKANICLIEGRASVTNNWRFYYAASDITPLQYAFLTGRNDAAVLLLALGADIEKSFTFQCTSVVATDCARSKTTGTLIDLFFDRNIESKPGVVDQVKSRALQEILFLSLILRKELPLLLDIFRVPFERHQQRFNSEKFKLNKCFVSNMFGSHPELEHIANVLEGADGSYRPLFTDIIQELNRVKFKVKSGEAPYDIYTPDGVESIIQQLEKMIDFYTKQSAKLDDTKSQERYREETLEKIFNNAKEYTPETSGHHFTLHFK